MKWRWDELVENFRNEEERWKKRREKEVVFREKGEGRDKRKWGRRGKEDEGPKQKGGKGKEKRGVGTEERKKEEGLIRIVFWNAGLRNKDDGF